MVQQQSRNRIMAILLAIAMISALLPVASKADAANPVAVTWYTDSGFATIETRGTKNYSSLFDAIQSIGDGDFVTIKLEASSRGDSTTVTINRSATVRLSAESATTTFLGGIIINNANASLSVANFYQNTSGTAINVRQGKLLLDSGAKIIGSSDGVVALNNATVQFGGGQVSSYSPSDSTNTVGKPNIITSTATPSPTPTPSGVAATGVAVSPNTLTIGTGKTQQLTATVLPNNASDKRVRWTSSDNTVATVSSTGVVRAVDTGGAYIRCTTVDGGYSYYVDVIVTQGNVSVTGISGLVRTKTIGIGESVTLTATVAPANATNKTLRWTSSNTSVATISSTGVVKGLKTGSTVIRAITNDGGYTTSCTLTVSNAVASPPPTTTPTPAASITTDIARNARLQLDGSSIGGRISRSSSYVALQPKSHNEVKQNSLSVLVRAFDRLGSENYDSLRYRITPIQLDIEPEMSEGMKPDARLTVSMRRLMSSTMSSTMYSNWNRYYSSKNISGPWELSSNSSMSAMTPRIRLPKSISKSKLQVLSWNGSSFRAMDSTDYAIVKIGDQYYVRVDGIGAGVYAVVYR